MKRELINIIQDLFQDLDAVLDVVNEIDDYSPSYDEKMEDCLSTVDDALTKASMKNLDMLQRLLGRQS